MGKLIMFKPRRGDGAVTTSNPNAATDATIPDTHSDKNTSHVTLRLDEVLPGVPRAYHNADTEGCVCGARVAIAKTLERIAKETIFKETDNLREKLPNLPNVSAVYDNRGFIDISMRFSSFDYLTIDRAKDIIEKLSDTLENVLKSA